MSPTLRVVVVTYVPGEALGTFLDSLAKATTLRYDVVLSDNVDPSAGETDDGAVEAAATRSDVHLLRNGSNLGYGRAANRGVAWPIPDGGVPAEEWLLVANPDVVFDPGSLDTLVDAAARWPDAGAFGPVIRTPAGELYPSARALPSLGRGIGHALFGWWWPANPWTRSYRNESGAPVEGPTGWLSGACLLLRREAFEAVNGFDETYFMYFEDLDLARRLADAGWPSVHVPSSVVTHTGGHSTQRDPETARAMLEAHHRSAWQYLSRQYSGWAWLPVRLVLRAGLAARAALGRRLPKMGEGARPTRSVSPPDRV